MRHHFFVLLCAAVFGLVGCGGDDADSGDDGQPDAAAADPDAGDDSGDGDDLGDDQGDPGDDQPDAGVEPDGGDGSGANCESSNDINGVNYSAICTDGECQCSIDGDVVDTCTLDSDTCTTIINEDEFVVGCCEFELP